ncbi:MAG: general secretion pathway protein GspK [Pirellulaceae bacterium]|nr:MAG: general secretion pathway protein GspK [Pirellulaceae bacterium]
MRSVTSYRRNSVCQTRREAGAVLLIVLFVIVVVSLSAYTFTELMLTHYEGARTSVRQAQTRALVDSGIEMVKYLLFLTEDERQAAGGIYDNQAALRGVVVVPDNDPRQLGCFSVLAPSLDSDGNSAGVRFGLEDESTRLNLNFLPLADRLVENGGRTLLMALPGMTEDIADAILDWLDEDDEPREFGAESDYYSRLQPPYQPKNGPLDSVEELLLVRGVTPELLFGLDTNRNGIIDPHELSMQAAGANTAVLLNQPELQRGWAPYLTLYSAEKNVNSSGQPRINVNQENMEQLYNELVAVLPVEWAIFIVAYRQNGPYTGDAPSQPVPADAQLDLGRQPSTTIGQLLDLVGAKVQVQFFGTSDAVVIDSPFVPDIGAMNLYLPTLLDNCSVTSAQVIPGRININQAPRVVLMGIPGMDEELVDEIIRNRDVTGQAQVDNPNLRFETWLLTEGLMFNEEGQPDIARMKQLTVFCCGKGDVYRAQVVGYFQEGGVSSRAEIVIDNTQAVPQVVFWRDLSHLGRGYNLATLGINLGNQLGL